MNMKITWNIKYALAQGFYWMLYGSLIAYASVFLLDRGYSNSQIGIFLAIGFMASVFLQQMVASITDKLKKITIVTVSQIALLALFVCSFALVFVKGTIVSVLYILSAVLIMLLQPLTNAINFYMSGFGVEMNFGVARSAGSLFCAILSTVLGIVVERTNPSAVPITCAGVCVVLMMDYFWIAAGTRGQKKNDEIQKSDKPSSFVELIRKNQKFFVFLLGVMGLYFGHNLINSFYFQIVSSCGGNSQDMGIMLAFAAVVELPGMIFFSKLRAKFDSEKLIKFSAVFFGIKMIATYFAPTIWAQYLAMALQALAFAIFTPAYVGYVDEVFEKKDAVKGQSLVTGTITLSAVAATLTGGNIIDRWGVRYALLVGIILSLAGVALTFVGVRKTK